MPRWYNTPPLDIRDVPADKSHYGSQSKLTPLWIVVHATAGTSSLDWLTRTSVPPVSIHRLIARDGAIYKIVPDEWVAWHVGKGILLPGPSRRLTNANNVCLGVELENTNDGTQDYTTQQMDALARQVIEWWGAYGYLPLVGHAALDTRKSDPYAFDWQSLGSLIAWRLAGVTY